MTDEAPANNNTVAALAVQGRVLFLLYVAHAERDSPWQPQTQQLKYTFPRRVTRWIRMGQTPTVHTSAATFINCYNREIQITEAGSHALPYPIISLSMGDVTYHISIDSDSKFEQLWAKLMDLKNEV